MSNSVDSGTIARELTVAICGNPNCGKTTLFNALTGLRQKVGNYPGVTVEKTSGTFRSANSSRKYLLVDTPGSYSLAAFSPDEYIAAQALCGSIEGEKSPDLIICVIDATCLERGLYLLYQVMQVGRPIMVALNMIDLAERHGIKIDIDKLSELLGGIKVLPVVASKGKGVEQLKSDLDRLADDSSATTVEAYDPATMEELKELMAGGSDGSLTKAEYLRILFDRSGPAEAAYLESQGDNALSLLEESRRRIIEKFGSLSVGETAPLTRLAQDVYGQVAQVKSDNAPTRTQKLDRFLLHPILGPVILLSMMMFMFHAIFSWAEPIMNFIDHTFGALAGQVELVMVEGPLRSLVIDGLIGGVGSVLIFLPQIIILFLFIAFLEDSGYMTRAAFLVDRLFGWCGLSGKSFVPLLSSFACAIPGIMATRTIENRNLRIVTIMVAPLMSCSARLPVYTIMIAAFIPHETYYGIFNLPGMVLTALYLLGLGVAVVIAFIFKKLVFKNERGTFMTEMPSYNLPNFRSVAIRIVNRVQAFLKRAGTVILAITIIIWALSYYPRSSEIAIEYDSRTASAEEQYNIEVSAANQSLVALGIPAAAMDDMAGRFATLKTTGEANNFAADMKAEHPQDVAMIDLLAQRKLLEIGLAARISAIENNRAGAQLADSYFGRMGRSVAPLFAPLGWDWKITMATLASFPAREVIIATLGTIYNLGSDQDETSTTLIEKMRNDRWESGPRMGQKIITPASALSIMVFFALCAQCGATLVTIRQETSRWLYAGIAFGYMTSLAYISAFAVYQVASRIGF